MAKASYGHAIIKNVDNPIIEVRTWVFEAIEGRAAF
jgi:hypothetical protein